jgi:hypothetical protein
MAFIATVGLGLTGAAGLIGGIAATGLAAGTVANGIGAIKAGQAADKMESLAGQVPTATKSQYPQMAIDQATNELNSQNPFLAYQQRAIAGSQANSTATAQRNALDPSILLKMTQAYNGMSNDATSKNLMNNYGLRSGKIQDLYHAYGMGQQQDQLNYDNSMTAFNSMANLQNAAGQTRVNAWQNVGNGLLAAGSAATKATNA